MLGRRPPQCSSPHSGGMHRHIFRSGRCMSSQPATRLHQAENARPCGLRASAVADCWSHAQPSNQRVWPSVEDGACRMALHPWPLFHRIGTRPEQNIERRCCLLGRMIVAVWNSKTLFPTYMCSSLCTYSRPLMCTSQCGTQSLELSGRLTTSSSASAENSALWGSLLEHGGGAWCPRVPEMAKSKLGFHIALLSHTLLCCGKL